MSVLFLTGAGVSVNAGIPAYRSTGSSWDNPELEAKSHSNRYGNHLPELWDRHWGPVSELMTTARPTHTHDAIAAFQKKHESIVATQNIDDLHERAGSDNVAHLHGVMDAYCMRCKSHHIESWSGGIPQCLDCESYKTRPDVVLFGEMLDKKLMGGLEHFAQFEATHIIAVGTSLNVFPAAGLVFDTIGKVGKTTVFVNKEIVPMAKWMSYKFIGDADENIDRVLEMVDTQISQKA